MMSLLCVVLLSVGVPLARSHGWVWSPVSKNEMAYHHYQSGMPDDFRYEPQTSNHGNAMNQASTSGGASCGANDAAYNEGLDTWQQWYDAAGVDVPKIVPGTRLDLNITLTIDHGGQSWFELACADAVSEDADWVTAQAHKLSSWWWVARTAEVLGSPRCARPRSRKPY